MNTPETVHLNSQTEIQKRIAIGNITWAGPLIMLSSRTVIGLIILVLVAATFFRDSAISWTDAFSWWRVYGVLVGLGCLIPLHYLTRLPTAWVGTNCRTAGIPSAYALSPLGTTSQTVG